MTPTKPRSLTSALLALTVAASVLAPVAAQAAEGFATANVNMRSGPSTRYPAVTLIPVGTPVEIHGCLRDTPWCDVSFYNGRGWVAGRYVQAEYQRRRVYVEPDYYDNLGIPLITFDIGNYWDRNYRNRDFYRDRDNYRRDRPRRDYNTFERPRNSDDDGITFERPRRDIDQERIDRRRDDNARQFREEQNNRLERDRDRIDRRNQAGGLVPIQRPGDRQRNFENSQRQNFQRQDLQRQDSQRRDFQRRDNNTPGCLPNDMTCN